MESKPYKSLFITYDGLTDTLGQSQILPYIIGLAKLGYAFTILSCEKKERYESKGQFIQEICNLHGISWHPLFFHRTPPIVAKYYDLFNLKRTARKLYLKHRFDIIHCRSYLAAEIGMELKAEFGCRFLFDMRGFWVDERVDGGLWNMGSPFYRFAYKHYKKKEGKLISTADHIISLTETGKKEIKSWKYYKSAPITVVPCSADLNLFTIAEEQQKVASRKHLGISNQALVLSYLGSLGTWYLIDEMLTLFQELKTKYKSAVLLILTPDDPNIVHDRATKLGLMKEDIRIYFAERNDVPFLMKASDVSVSFIKPAYSKIASSPTKLGELLAMGIPVICNDIGDVRKIVVQSGGGIIVDDFSSASLKSAVDALPTLLSVNKNDIRKSIYSYYDLSNAIATYEQVYQQLVNKK